MFLPHPPDRAECGSRRAHYTIQRAIMECPLLWSLLLALHDGGALIAGGDSG